MFCRKLIKWVVVPTAVVAGSGYMLFGRGVASYVQTAYHDVRQAVVGSVPIDFEIRRARQLLQKVDPDIKTARREVARAEVDLDSLDRQVAELEHTLARVETKMQKHRGFLRGEGDAATVFDGRRSYGERAVRTELCRTFDMYKSQRALLASKIALRKRQSKVLEASRTKLLAVRSEREKLQDALETLEARKRQLDALAATTAHAADLDTSNLREAKALVSQIRKRLDVSQKIIQEELFLSSGQVAADDDGRDIVSELDAYFADHTGGRSEKTQAGLHLDTSHR